MAIEAITETALAVYSAQQIDLIRKNLAPDINDDDFALFLEVCRGTGLNPFRRQIYAIGRKSKIRDDNGGERWVTKMTIQTGIDGYRLIAARTRQLAGIDDAIYDTEDAGHPNKASVTVWRMVAGQRVPFTATARWREYAQGGKSKDGTEYLTGKWADMPYLMLGKCAEALALRKAFPEELSGVYTADEMDQADNSPAPANTVESTPRRPAQPAQERKLGFTVTNEVLAAKLAAKNVTPEQWAALKRVKKNDRTALYAALDQYDDKPAGDPDSLTLTEIDAEGHDLAALGTGAGVRA